MTGVGRPISAWRPRFWVATTAVVAFVTGIGLGIWETLGDGRAGVYTFCAFLIGFGSGAVGLDSLRRP